MHSVGEGSFEDKQNDNWYQLFHSSLQFDLQLNSFSNYKMALCGGS
jgi:hypothetical protein